jgi:hypothetical protein
MAQGDAAKTLGSPGKKIAVRKDCGQKGLLGEKIAVRTFCSRNHRITFVSLEIGIDRRSL